MATSYLDKEGLLYFLQHIRPNATPQMDGTASTGTAKRFANQDHVHPTDTTRASQNDLDSLSDEVLDVESTVTALETDMGNKVDKVTGKGLSTNDYTNADKAKLDGIDAGAEANVNADWSASSGDALILNKPTLGAAAARGVVTSISSDSLNLPTVTAVKDYVATAITGAAAFQGTAPTSFAPTGYKKGYYWVVGTAGTYVGQTCEAGDMIFAVADYASSYKAADFTVVQTNLDITAITNSEIDTIVAS